MTILELLRNTAFWTLDYIKGGRVRKYMSTLRTIDMLGGYLDYQRDRLDDLLHHCINTVPAYKQMSSTNLVDWPVVNKNELRENKKSHLSSLYGEETLISMSTSGSTGTPFSCLQDTSKKKHVNAEVIYYSGKTGYKIGQRIIYIRSLVKKIAKSPLQQFLSNIYHLNSKDLSDKGLEELFLQIKKLSSGSGAMILSYASTLDAFRKYFEKHGYDVVKDCKIFGIISGSEMLYDVTRESMEHAFGCKCFSRYSNEENGILGQDEVENNVFLDNRASYIVEILKFDSDEPASLGEVGRVVVTDLYNYAMPMVRYDTGDAGAWVEIKYNNQKRTAIGNFAGRAVDIIFDCDGNQISPHTITNGMWQFEGISQFQLVQKQKNEYEMRICAGSSYEEAKLLEVLHSIVGEKANIKIISVDEIPILSSGKRRYIVNEMLK